MADKPKPPVATKAPHLLGGDLGFFEEGLPSRALFIALDDDWAREDLSLSQLVRPEGDSLAVGANRFAEAHPDWHEFKLLADMHNIGYDSVGSRLRGQAAPIKPTRVPGHYGGNTWTDTLEQVAAGSLKGKSYRHQQPGSVYHVSDRQRAGAKRMLELWDNMESDWSEMRSRFKQAGMDPGQSRLHQGRDRAPFILRDIYSRAVERSQLEGIERDLAEPPALIREGDVGRGPEGRKAQIQAARKAIAAGDMMASQAVAAADEAAAGGTQGGFKARMREWFAKNKGIYGEEGAITFGGDKPPTAARETLEKIVAGDKRLADFHGLSRERATRMLAAMGTMSGDPAGPSQASATRAQAFLRENPDVTPDIASSGFRARVREWRAKNKGLFGEEGAITLAGKRRADNLARMMAPADMSEAAVSGAVTGQYGHAFMPEPDPDFPLGPEGGPEYDPPPRAPTGQNRLGPQYGLLDLAPDVQAARSGDFPPSSVGAVEARGPAGGPPPPAHYVHEGPGWVRDTTTGQLPHSWSRRDARHTEWGESVARLRELVASGRVTPENAAEALYELHPVHEMTPIYPDVGDVRSQRGVFPRHGPGLLAGGAELLDEVKGLLGGEEGRAGNLLQGATNVFTGEPVPVPQRISMPVGPEAAAAQGFPGLTGRQALRSIAAKGLGAAAMPLFDYVADPDLRTADQFWRAQADPASMWPWGGLLEPGGMVSTPEAPHGLRRREKYYTLPPDREAAVESTQGALMAPNYEEEPVNLDELNTYLTTPGRFGEYEEYMPEWVWRMDMQQQNAGQRPVTEAGVIPSVVPLVTPRREPARSWSTPPKAAQRAPSSRAWAGPLE